MFRVPGTAKPSERWTKAAEAAHQGVIAKLRILSMDIVMATSDGTDRQSMRPTLLLESLLHIYAQTGWQLHCRAGQVQISNGISALQIYTLAMCLCGDDTCFTYASNALTIPRSSPQPVAMFVGRPWRQGRTLW